MKTVEIIGYNRANLGKSESKRLRAEGNVPCVLYGGKEQVHFHSPMILFRDIVYTAEAHFVDINVEGKKAKAILQDVQFHPVSEIILHADFLELFDDKKVKMSIPVKTTGSAPGVQQGGKLVMKMTHLNIKALPKDMPEFIEVDISKLDLGKTVKVGAITPGDFEILNSPLVSIASVEVPRAMRGKGEDGEAEEETTEEEGAGGEG
ncbi:MAG: 50S ribosomal protein L25/general stress protein Ctc [Cyclobacteriaceae bacterium]|nr:50S ribosomal protein L25/general stress protein Ctc [Cyclobacteriaceae bacterium HetDA_MAG_MS6]